LPDDRLPPCVPVKVRPSATRMLDDAGARYPARDEVPGRGQHLVEPVRVDQDKRRDVDRGEDGADVRVQVAGEFRRETTRGDRGAGPAGEPLALRSVPGGVPPIQRAPRVADV